MFSFFRNVKMPSPPEEMLKKHLACFTTSIDSEIISGAYEPRFGMYALGTANGYLYIINKHHHIFRSPKSVNYPLLKIISLPNSSSFFSICSKTMFQNHPSRIEKPNPHDLEMLNSIKSSKIQNICTHWIIKPDGILSRTTPLEFDIVDIALSPVHPEFALLLTSGGSIYGFSIESLNLTNLYINIFEKKPVKSICWSSGYRFLIAHEIIEGLDVQKLELGSQYRMNAQMIDSIDQWTAAIDEKGNPNLFMYTNVVSSINAPKGSKAIFVGMLNGSNWISIIRSETGDIVYENKNPKLTLKGEYVMPETLIRYAKPFERSNPQEIAVSTDYGRFLYFDGKVIDHFMFKPPDVKFAFADEEDYYVFTVEKVEKVQKKKTEAKKKRKEKIVFKKESGKKEDEKKEEEKEKKDDDKAEKKSKDDDDDNESKKGGNEEDDKKEGNGIVFRKEGGRKEGEEDEKNDEKEGDSKDKSDDEEKVEKGEDKNDNDQKKEEENEDKEDEKNDKDEKKEEEDKGENEENKDKNDEDEESKKKEEEEEKKRKEEEEKRKKEEEEEKKRKEEEEKRKKEEEEEKKRKEEEEKRKKEEEEKKRKEEEEKRKKEEEEEKKRKEEEEKRKKEEEEEKKRKEEEEKRKKEEEEEKKRKEEEEKRKKEEEEEKKRKEEEEKRKKEEEEKKRKEEEEKRKKEEEEEKKRKEEEEKRKKEEEEKKKKEEEEKRKKEEEEKRKKEEEEEKASKEPEYEDLTHFIVYRYRHGVIRNHFKVDSSQVSNTPLGVSHEKVLFVEDDDDVCYFDLKKGRKTVLQTLDDLSFQRHTKRRFPDFVLSDGTVLNTKATEDGFDLVESSEKCPSSNIIDWRPFMDSIVYFISDRHLVFKDQQKKIIKSEDDQILAFEVVNYLGHSPKDGEEAYIVIVTSSRIVVLDFDAKEKKLRKIRKVKQPSTIAATFTKFGTLIVQTTSQVSMLPLPDVSSSVIDKIPISKNGRAALFHKFGAVLYEPNSVSLYLDDIQPPKLYDIQEPVIETPKVNKFLKLFGKKDDTVKDADTAFQYSRSSAMTAKISETQDMMQQLLVKANERGEMLNEMEIKANKLLTSAQKFHQMAKELRKNPWF